MFKSKWNLLYLILALLVLFTLFAVPAIVTAAINETKGQTVAVSKEYNYNSFTP